MKGIAGKSLSAGEACARSRWGAGSLDASLDIGLIARFHGRRWTHRDTPMICHAEPRRRRSDERAGITDLRVLRASA
jgi:hypothetical protein